MTLWRPHSDIRVKALGLNWRDGRLLASEIYSDDGSIKGVRPLGGSIEFGELAAAALIREFREELGVEVTIAGPPTVMENLYAHEGAQGHEILFLFEILLPDGAFAGQDCITYREDNGAACVARWYDLDALDVLGGVELYPTGLKALLIRNR